MIRGGHHKYGRRRKAAIDGWFSNGSAHFNEPIPEVISCLSVLLGGGGIALKGHFVTRLDLQSSRPE